MTFEKFYNQQFKPVFRFFYYKSVDFKQIEDLVQESFMRFYKSYHSKLTDAEESRKILFGICFNIYKDWVKEMVKNKTIKFIEEYDYEEGLVEFREFENDNFEVEFEERKKMLRIAIEKLNDKVKEVIKLRFLESKTRKEVSDILNMSEDMVYTYQKRGVKYLKDFLNKDK